MVWKRVSLRHQPASSTLQYLTPWLRSCSINLLTICKFARGRLVSSFMADLTIYGYMANG